MFIIADNISNVLYNDGNYVTHELITTQQQIDDFKVKIITKYAINLSIPESQLEFYWVIESNNPSSDCQRIINGDAFICTWSNNHIVGIDFTPEDTKGYLKFESDKTKISGNGINETASITLTVYESDKVTIKTNITATKFVPIQTPQGSILAKMDVLNGIGYLTFGKIVDIPLGHYVFPSPVKNLWNYKIWEYAEIDIYLDM